MAKQTKITAVPQELIVPTAPDDQQSQTVVLGAKSPVEQIAEDIRAALQDLSSALLNSSVRAHRIGTNLSMVKGGKPHGEFGRWIKSSFAPEFGLSTRTAQRFMQQARDLDYQVAEVKKNASGLADLTAEEIITRFKLLPRSLQSLDTTGDTTHSPDECETTEQPKRRGRRPVASKLHSSATPAVLAERILRFFEELDVLVSEAHEPESLLAKNRIQGIGAFESPLPLGGRIYLNGLTKASVNDRLAEVVRGYNEGFVSECLLLLRADFPEHRSQIIRNLPRVVFHGVPDGDNVPKSVLSDASVHKLILAYVGVPARLPALQALVADIGGDLFLPYRYLNPPSANTESSLLSTTEAPPS